MLAVVEDLQIYSGFKFLFKNGYNDCISKYMWINVGVLKYVLLLFILGNTFYNILYVLGFDRKSGVMCALIH